MLQDGKTQRPAAPTDFDGLSTQFAALRDDLAKLTASVASLAERRGRRMASDVSEGMGEALHYVERKGQSAEAELEKSIAAHPLLSIALAAGAGVVIGAMTRR
jgi:ElaB/YqjD/DUF883 family membrane-anchored ribosome-binding protein